MNNRFETGQSFGISMRVTPAHVEEALIRTVNKPKLSNKAFIAVLGSIAYQDNIKKNPIGFGKR